MSKDYLTQDQARNLVEQYMKNEKVTSTQEILDSGVIPTLQGFVIRPGKVSDSIFGGWVNYTDKKTGKEVKYENPPLRTVDGIPLRIMVRSERISTHDINRGDIPFKDQILAMNHNYMRRLIEQVLGSSQFDVNGLSDSSVVIATEDLEQIPFEEVIRLYMAKSTTSTSLYQHYKKGEREFCGHKLPDNLTANGPLPYPMDTPSTKSDIHDESLPPSELINRGICTPDQYIQIVNGCLVAFGKISQFLRERGIILADEKTEHGVNHKGNVVVQDEVFTMDSSRYWLLDDYNSQWEDLMRGKTNELNPKSFSKEFARGFSKGEQGYTEEERIQIAVRYIQGIQHLLGRRFEPDMRSREERIVTGLETIVNALVA